MPIILEKDSVKAEILELGAELKTLTVNGRELMWCRNADIWGKSSPILFPAIGNVKNNRTVINGNTVALKKHGFARDNVFNAEKTGKASAVFSYSYRPDASDSYPFACKLKLKYELIDSGIKITYEVENLSNSEMYFCIGAHPAIACTDLDNCTIEFENAETASTPVMDLITRMFRSSERIPRLNNERLLPLRYEMFDNDVVYFDEITSKSVVFSENGIKLAKIGFDGFTSLGLWTPAGKRAGFLCIEPWCSSDDYDNDNGLFKDKKGIISLGSGGTFICSMTIMA